jgi:ribosome-associated protein
LAKSVTTKSALAKSPKPAARKTPAKKSVSKKSVSAKVSVAPPVEAIEVTEAELIARRAAELTLTKKASRVTLMDLRAVTDMADFFVICSADSDTQVKAIADAVLSGLREDGVQVHHSEGYQTLHWILLDYVDVVVHIFYKEMRDFYNIEKLWGDAVFTEIKDEPSVTMLLKPKRTAKKTALAASAGAANDALLEAFLKKAKPAKKR